jgi:hypothetical protein
MLEDNFDDKILTVIKSLNSRTGWNKYAIALQTKLLKMLEARHYIYFMGDANSYGVGTIGGSYLYDVPLYKQGNLLKFRGKRIRIVCIHSGNFRRGYMAGVVSDSPPDKIVSKIIYKYTFPDYVNSHKILYKSRRFIVFQTNKDIPILLKGSSSGYIDVNLWDSLLIDGKEGVPIATFKHNADGSVKGKRVSWRDDGHIYPSLKNAILNLK